MVQMKELPEDLQEEIRRLLRGIKGMACRPTKNHPFYAVYLLLEFRDNESDSCIFSREKDTINSLKKYLDDHCEERLSVIFSEIEHRLEKFPKKEHCKKSIWEIAPETGEIRIRLDILSSQSVGN